jgi:DNA recombination protein RmuC
MQIALIIVSIGVLAALVQLFLRTRTSDALREELASRKTLNEQQDRRIDELVLRAARADELLAANARLGAELDAERKATGEKLLLLQETESRLKREFENLANRILEEKGTSFANQHAERLSTLLTPFREQIEGFRKRVDDVHKSDSEGFARLMEQVRQLQELNVRVSSDANNLAAAIKGDARAQGDWGELIVERIFESSGLERGREFEAQAGLRNEDGRLFKPDFVVYLPGDKAVIVDSKMSLTAYERYCSAPDEKSKNAALAEHLASVRRHIDELHAKEYQQLLGNRTLDFVLMCIPLDGAFQLALREDGNLLYDIARSGVVLAGPATLMVTLRLVAQIWRREKENRNAEKIADRAGRLYDQVVLVYESMADAQKRLVGVQESFDTAMKRLRDGTRGSLVSRVEDLRLLGAKTTKRLPADPAGESDAPPLLGEGEG